MSDRVAKLALIVGTLMMLPILLYSAYARPGYFTSTSFLGSLLAGEALLMSAWLYRRIFLPIVLLIFLFAGTSVPFWGFWVMARWVFLALGAAVGAFILLRERKHHFHMFHGLALLAVVASLVSSAVSRYPSFALLKATSLLLLFLYAGTGARLAASGRESRFVSGLVLGCEIFVGVLGLFYLGGKELMGNPNSLGCIISVCVAPILLWSTLIDDDPAIHHRRLLLFGVAMYLVWHSHSRAGLMATFITCSLLCLCLRKYRLFAHGIVILLILVTAAAIFDPDAFWMTLRATESTVVYKDKDAALGVLSSRQTPWQHAIQSIRSHFWFGSGFGTTDNGVDASAFLSNFSTVEGVTSENGSSYLSILSWVGLLGAIPFTFLLVSLLGKVVRTCFWMLNTTNPCHLAIPLAMVTLSGLIHAAFEDWLFAPGYYVCVFFWAMAFILTDYAPWAPLPSFSRPWQPSIIRPQVGATAPIQ